MNSNPIGVFDSGIGGLTVVREIIQALPNESITYLGDTARVPYGTRDKEIISKFALELTQFLLDRNVKFLVVACNTVSATCLEEIRKISPVPVLGVIEPAAELATKLTKNKRVGVIGTTATIKSGAYEKNIKDFNNEIEVISKACPLFVPIVEEDLISHPVSTLMANEYLSSLKKSDIDTLIMGCTHYPLLQNVISDSLGGITLIDSAKPTAGRLKNFLEENDLLTDSITPHHLFFVTDSPEKATKIANQLFGGKLPGEINKVAIF